MMVLTVQEQVCGFSCNKNMQGQGGRHDMR